MPLGTVARSSLREVKLWSSLWKRTQPRGYTWEVTEPLDEQVAASGQNRI